MRALGIAAAAILQVAFVSHGRASDECSAVFAQWVKLSELRIRKPSAPAGTPGKPAPPQGPCIPSEPARQELLEALRSAAGKCAAADATDKAAQQTKTMIGINQSFIGSIVLCPQSDPPAPPGKAAPEAARPTVRPRACLEISRLAANRYVVSNRRCAGTSVLAVIETQAASGTVRCKAYTIETKTTVASPGEAKPTLNYECALDQPRCSQERVAAMFPECEW